DQLDPRGDGDDGGRWETGSRAREHAERAETRPVQDADHRLAPPGQALSDRARGAGGVPLLPLPSPRVDLGPLRRGDEVGDLAGDAAPWHAGAVEDPRP